MSLSIREAERMAVDPLHSHSTVSLDLAASTLRDRPPSGADAACYAELAMLKARLQRIKGWAGKRSSVAPEAALDVIARLVDGTVL